MKLISTLQSVMRKLLEIPLPNFQRLRLDLASINPVDTGHDYTTLLRYNDRHHLEGLEDGERA